VSEEKETPAPNRAPKAKQEPKVESASKAKKPAPKAKKSEPEVLPQAENAEEVVSKAKKPSAKSSTRAKNSEPEVIAEDEKTTEVASDEVKSETADSIPEEENPPAIESDPEVVEVPTVEVVAEELETSSTEDVLDLTEPSEEISTASPVTPRRVPQKKALLYFGEVVITLGLILALFVGYKAFVQDSVVADSQVQKAEQFGKGKDSHKFRELSKVNRPAQIFGRMYVPRFGSKWTRLVAEGTRWHPVLNEIGVGHYIGTAMPGQKGNFAVAAHRGGFGGAFKEIHRLVAGDKVYVETRDSWFVYKYLQTKIVAPTDLNVIRSVPKELVGAKVGGRYMTMTSCTPIYVNTQRIIVWLELEKKIPVRAGAPKELKLGDK